MPTHRTFSSEFKTQVVLEILSGSKSQAQLAREHRLKPDTIAPLEAPVSGECPPTL